VDKASISTKPCSNLSVNVYSGTYIGPTLFTIDFTSMMVHSFMLLVQAGRACAAQRNSTTGLGAVTRCFSGSQAGNSL
jgi:hypothetical protein